MNYIFITLAAIIGFAVSILFKKNNSLNDKLLIFSAGLLLSITILELFPELYESTQVKNIGLYIILGVGLQIGLEILSKGIEHGHLHTNYQSNSIIPTSVIIGLFIHSFLEGTPINNSQNGINHNNHFLIALSIHKISESIVLSSFIISLNIRQYLMYIILILFMFSAPIGSYVGTFMDEHTYTKLMGIVAGIFLHISSTIIFESNKNHSFDFYKLILTILGLSIGIGLIYLD